MVAWRREQKQNPELERMARRGELKVDVEKVFVLFK